MHGHVNISVVKSLSSEGLTNHTAKNMSVESSTYHGTKMCGLRDYRGLLTDVSVTA